MIIEFTDGKMLVKYPSGVNDVYIIDDIKKVKANYEQEILRLKVQIATQDVYLKEMKATKPPLLARAFARLRKIV